MPSPPYTRIQTNGSSSRSHLKSDGKYSPPDPHSLTRLELIALLEFERHNHPCATFSTDRPNCESILAASQFKDVTIESLKSQLSACEARAKRLEDIVRDLREELSTLSKQQSPVSSPLMSTLSVPVGSFSPKGRSTTPDICLSMYPSGLAIAPKPSNASTNTSSSSESSSSRAESDHREIVTRIQSLNTIITAAAATLCKSLHWNDHLLTVPDRRTIDGINECLVRSTWVVGERVASELIAEPLPIREMMTHGSAYEVPQILAQMVMEMVLAKWAALILGWVEAGFVAFEPDAHAQWYRAVRKLRSQLDPENKEEWISSVMRSAKDTAYISGWAFKPSNDTNDKNDPAVALSPFVAAVQGLRKALDYLRNNSDTWVEIHLVIPGTPFSPSPARMNDGYAIGKRGVFGVMRRSSVSENNIVIGNTGLGLQGSEEKLILPPTVIREKAFLDAFSRSAQVEEPKIRVRVGGGRSGALVVQSPAKAGPQ